MSNKNKYHYWDNDGNAFVGMFFENEKPANSKPYNGENYIKPMYNPQTNEVYEGATPEEINAYNKSLVPENVRSRQLRLALIMSGFNLTDISTAIENLQEPNKSIAKIEWEYATSFDRNNQLLISLGSMLNLTEQDIDNLFILANTL